MDIEDEPAPALEKNARRRQFRTRQLVMMMFVGAMIMAAGQFLGPMISRLYFSEFGELFRGGLLFFGFTIVAFSLIQLYLEFGSISLRTLAFGPVTFSGTREESQPAETVPNEITVDGSRESPRIPSIDSPEALAARLTERLEREIDLQSRRANINLTLGILAAITGLLFLGWLSFLTATELNSSIGKPTTINAMLYWGSFASKVSLSLAANVFALFFFASYRRSLSEIRYFHNELTNIQARLVAIGLTTNGAADLRKMAVKSLVDIERNFILRKGETTTEVALREHDRQDFAALISLLADGARLPQIAADRAQTRAREKRARA